MDRLAVERRKERARSGDAIARPVWRPRARHVAPILCCFLASGVSASTRSLDDASWLTALFEEGRKLFYRSCSRELLAHSQHDQLTTQEREKVVEAESRYPRLYGLLANLYYQEQKVALQALIEAGGQAARSRVASLYSRLVRDAASSFVEALFRPSPNAEYLREILPAFRDKDRVDLVLMSIGYFAVLSPPPASPGGTWNQQPPSEEFDRQWGLDAGNFRAAHRLTRGAGVKVAVIDSGLDHAHPIFATTPWGRHFALLGRDGPPWSAQAPAFDSGGHGTMVASVVTRYAPEARITAYKKGDGDTTNNAPFPLLRAAFMAASVYRAVQDGNHVINISSGIAGDYPYLRRACRYAYDNNVLIVTGGPYYLGRYLGLDVTMPAQYQTTLSVTAIERRADGTLGYWDQTAPDPTTTLASPNGVFGASPTYLEQGDRYVPSISAATPVVAAAAALAMSVYPRTGMEPAGEYVETVRRLMIRSARREPLGFTGFSPEIGHGLVDAEGLVRAAIREAAVARSAGAVPPAGIQPAAIGR